MQKTDNISHLVLLASQQNLLAQQELYQRFSAEMLGLCLRMIGKNDVAEDALQEAFIKAFSQLSRLKEPNRFAGWFKRIVINECLIQLKQKNYLTAWEDELPQIAEEEENELEHIGFETINIEIDKLPNGCRQILVLYLLEDLKHKEIAKMLNVSVSTVKSQYQYALKLLRTKLKEVMV
ncbi:MAG: RNA polymerase sigma-70 factor (ECF subfamily) [Flavobacteriales bacterium]